MATDIDKMEALKENESFVKEMSTATTAEEVRDIFAKYGVAFTLEEAQAMVEEIKKHSDEELSAEELDNVTGGYIGLAIMVALLIFVAVITIRQRAKSRR